MNKIELNDLMVCAFRYALGRRSYIVAVIGEILVTHKAELSDSSKAVICRDINKAIAKNHDGMDCDSAVWRYVRDHLNATDKNI